MPVRGKSTLQNKAPLLQTPKREKARLRAFYKQKLSSLSPLMKRQKEKQLESLLLKLPFWPHISHIAGFLALKDEPWLSRFYKLYANKICFPYISNDRLEFYKLEGSKSLSKDQAQSKDSSLSKNPSKLKDQTEHWLTSKDQAKSKGSTTSKDQTKPWCKTGISTDNRFSIPEPYPLPQNKIPLKKISVFLIPARAFDHQGGRLGRGLGFYDKSLTKLSANSINKDHKSPPDLSKMNKAHRKPKQSFTKAKTDVPLDFWLEFFNHHGQPSSSSAVDKGSQRDIGTKNSRTKKMTTKQAKPLQGLKKACFIGIAFSLQIQRERLSLEPHDIPMDLLVSEDFILMPLKR